MLTNVFSPSLNNLPWEQVENGENDGSLCSRLQAEGQGEVLGTLVCPLTLGSGLWNRVSGDGKEIIRTYISG